MSMSTPMTETDETRSEGQTVWVVVCTWGLITGECGVSVHTSERKATERFMEIVYENDLHGADGRSPLDRWFAWDGPGGKWEVRIFQCTLERGDT